MRSLPFRSSRRWDALGREDAVGVLLQRGLGRRDRAGHQAAVDRVARDEREQQAVHVAGRTERDVGGEGGVGDRRKHQIILIESSDLRGCEIGAANQSSSLL
jgi:hypothetical protein